MAISTETKETLTKPVLYSDTEVRETLGVLKGLDEERGVSTFMLKAGKYLRTLGVLQRQFDAMMASYGFLTGDESLSAERQLKRTATTFFRALSNRGIQDQCHVYEIDYDAFETVEEREAALVEAFIARQNNGTS